MPDPNLFLNNNAIGDFNDSSPDGSGYGAIPAVEQNQTYFAYFDGAGGTGPEIIDQTGYFIKYLIDSEGNVANPEPGNIALLNLLDNFEPGKKAVVNASSAVSTNLIGGPFNITGVGRISPILITETGSNQDNYILTMSFNNIDSNDVINTPEFGFKATKITDQILQYISPETKINAPSVILSNPQYASSTYTFVSNSFDYSNRVKFDVSGEMTANFPSSDIAPINSTITINVRIKKNSEIFVSQDITFVRATYDNQYSLPFGLTTGYQNFSIGDTVEVYVDSLSQYNPNNNDFIISAENYSFSAVNEYPSNVATASAGYWTIGDYLTGSNVSVLTSSLGLSKWYSPNFIQDTPSASLAFGFSDITLPFQVQPGDYIRFEYNKNKVYNITNVKTSNKLYLTVYPSIPTGSVLDHFCLYRIINDGTYVILDVRKNQSISLNGFLLPQYVSSNITNNLDKITSDLRSKNLIS